MIWFSLLDKNLPEQNIKGIENLYIESFILAVLPMFAQIWFNWIIRKKWIFPTPWIEFKSSGNAEQQPWLLIDIPGNSELKSVLVKLLIFFRPLVIIVHRSSVLHCVRMSIKSDHQNITFKILATSVTKNCFPETFYIFMIKFTYGGHILISFSHSVRYFDF